jgi:2-polyprenyl-3-methyl-5-hydroxy-6-metoxy-1,4-benzoquinol methylase
MPLVAEALLLALHLAAGGNAWEFIPLVALAAPAGYAAMASGRSAFPAILLPLLALADNLIDPATGRLLAEIAVLTAVTLGGARLAYLVDEERHGLERVRAETLQRAARLKDQSGYWQSVARTRMGSYVTGVEERFILEAMQWRPGAIVLDVGAASGRLEHALAEHAEHVIATDLDREEVYAMADDTCVTPVVVSATPGLPVAVTSVDVVSCIEAPAASAEAWFRDECLRVLTPGGAVIVTVFNARSYKGLIARLTHKKGAPWSGLYYQASLSRRLRDWDQAGFDIVRSRGFYWSPLPRNSDSRLVAGWAALERLLGLRGLTALSPWVMLELRKRDAPESARIR